MDASQLGMLQRIQNMWIEGVLEKSLHYSVCQQTKFTEPKRVDILRFVLQSRLTQNAGSVRVTELANHCLEESMYLLLLGETGAGKTMTLLELARITISQATADTIEQIPIFLKLSSWSGQKLESWLSKELYSIFGLPYRTTENWVRDAKLFLLLDGLDQVSETLQIQCIEAINDFRSMHKRIRCTVSCSTSSYNKIGATLQVDYQATIQPLHLEQVRDYVQVENLSSCVYEMIEIKNELRQSALSPLYLDILSLICCAKSNENWTAIVSSLTSSHDFLHVFVQQQLNRSELSDEYSVTQVYQWLTYLAKTSSRIRPQLIFVDSISLDWLPNRTLRTIMGIVIPISTALVALLLGLAVVFLSVSSSYMVFLLIALLFFAGVFGGAKFIKHGLSRLILWRSGYMPISYKRFLDLATECHILYRVGHGYMFVHPLVEDYFNKQQMN